MCLPSINGTLTGSSQNINKMYKPNEDHKIPDHDRPGLTLNEPIRTSSCGPI